MPGGAAVEVAVSAAAVVGATSLTHPIDLIKVRLQLQHGAATKRTATTRGMNSRGLFATASHVMRSQGVLGMWAGATPALLRSAVYGGIRLGLYVVFCPLCGSHFLALAGGASPSYVSSGH